MIVSLDAQDWWMHMIIGQVGDKERDREMARLRRRRARIHCSWGEGDSQAARVGMAISLLLHGRKESEQSVCQGQGSERAMLAGSGVRAFRQRK